MVLDLNDEVNIVKLLEGIDLQLDNSAADEFKYTSVTIDGRDVTEDIRSKQVGGAVSIVSKLSAVRRYLVKLQREMASRGQAVLEGRDTGSVVFPRAALKIFLTASLEERIKRRLLQISKKGEKADKSHIEKEIRSRDNIDSNRQDSPLIVPEGGITLDTTGMSIREVVDNIKQLYRERVNVKN
ncbi:MAG: (d)CMP kinase [Actinomycetota bacterium]|nr:(d)CMP kinase [Actinomycetota bacterium]